MKITPVHKAIMQSRRRQSNAKEEPTSVSLGKDTSRTEEGTTSNTNKAKEGTD